MSRPHRRRQAADRTAARFLALRRHERRARAYYLADMRDELARLTWYGWRTKLRWLWALYKRQLASLSLEDLRKLDEAHPEPTPGRIKYEPEPRRLCR